MTRAEKLTADFTDYRRDPALLRGALSNSPQDPFLRLIRAGHGVKLEDDAMSLDGHRVRWLVVDGDHIGQRSTMAGLERLANRLLSVDSEQWEAIKREEMDREGLSR